MSDSLEQLSRRYEEDIRVDHHPRSIGLFTIPEYPELEERGMWSAALQAIATTLRYLAPATLLTLFWGHHSFFFSLIRHIDNAFRAIVFSSEEQKQSVLKWLNEAGPVQVDQLETVWKHGWIVCSVLDNSLPGACAGHPPTRLSLKHAQAIADHYLGVEPVFSRQELETNDSLSKHQGWRLATYLERVREALSKITPPVSKPASQRTSPETTNFTLDYVAKGSGLTAAQVHHKMSFKIYPTAQQSLDPAEITIVIRGPKDTYGMTVLPPILGKAQKIRQKLLGLQSKQSFTENSLPITQGVGYLRSYGNNDMNKTYYIPKTVYDIDIEALKREDHTKINYTVQKEGKYEVSITSRGQNIVGSPFTVTASHNIIHLLEKENFCLEDGEEIDIVDVKTDRKVVLRIVDFVTEKMLLRENGVLEKISEDEAKQLMAADVENERSVSITEVKDHATSKEFKAKADKFKNIASKILAMNRACKIFNAIGRNKRNENTFTCPKKQTDIPDIVNSTLIDVTSNPFIVTEKRDKYIVPENISVSIVTEKAKPFYEEHAVTDVKNTSNIFDHFSGLCTPDSLDKIPEEQVEDDISVDSMTSRSTNNPFLTDTGEDFTVEKKMGTFVKTEFERNNAHNEETKQSSIAIIVDKNDSPTPTTNPFYEAGFEQLDRPKTPVYKIITGAISDRIDSPYLDPRNELIPEEMLGNEFVNPFFVHRHYEQPPMTDFIIGAPVSLPPMVNVPTPEPDMTSLIATTRKHVNSETNHPRDEAKDISSSVYSTPEHTSTPKTTDRKGISSTFHSFDSSLTDTFDMSNASTTSDNQFGPYRIETSQANREFSPRKDNWDSAYVSIDDNNSSPDNNNNENSALSDTSNKRRLSSGDERYDQDLCNMGPAERELWQSCVELNDTNKIQDDVKPYRWEIKRQIFTPIIEESDRSISSGMKETSLKHTETDPVTVAFAELNDVYEEYFLKNYLKNTENSSTAVEKELNLEVEHKIESDETGVESASEKLSDVTRHKTEQEGKISEVQANVTESVSVSHTLQDDKQSKYKDETQFGEKVSNIVLEKKKYWDEKIRQIEAKSEEIVKPPKKRRSSAKQLKHDSLSKRRGKQIVKNFLSAGDETQTQLAKPILNNKKPEYSTQETTSKQRNDVNCEEKLVEKWKRYWDEKLEIEHEDHEIELRLKSPRYSSKSPQRYQPEQATMVVNSSESDNKLKLNATVKHELPEEVFKAFETSPKRFFGTSRKHILNKIDTFIGKPSSTITTSPVEPSTEVSPDSGLVSSRISLFHNMSNTEPLPWAQKKIQSFHNIGVRKESEINILSSIDISESDQQTSEHTEAEPSKTINGSMERVIPIKEKRSRIAQRSFNKSFDETDAIKNKKMGYSSTEISKPSYLDKYKKTNVLRKTSISKSEMDIFNKISTEADDGLDKHKSYDELPKINVKNFISLYESVSKSSDKQKPVRKVDRPTSVDSQKHWQPISVNKDAEKKLHKPSYSGTEKRNTGVGPTSIARKKLEQIKGSQSISVESVDTKTDEEALDVDTAVNDPKCKETTYVSLSDIELEIVESRSNTSTESSPERTGQPHIDYKNRFKQAKQFFQSLEELRDDKKPRKLNECEILLLNKTPESLENEKPQKKLKKKKKSHSMPSSELAKYWNQMQETQQEPAKEETKLVKISEKFHVEDLFSDVMEGKLSRQGSLRGIPHKKAVLEAFRSMENICDGKISPYDMATSEVSHFSNEGQGRSAQTYLREYPYLPTTDPSKFHSRLDVKASGLITLKELLDKKGRRNSVPDLRLNTKFSEDL